MFFKELQKEDLSTVVNMYVDAFNSPPWNDKWTEDSAYNRLKQMMNCEGSYGLLCMYNKDSICGMILGNHEYYYDCMHFNIKEFCVNKQYHGKGIGTILLDEFLKRLKEKGIEKAVLLTSKTEGTEGFYKRRDFNNINDMVVMEKNI